MEIRRLRPIVTFLAIGALANGSMSSAQTQAFVTRMVWGRITRASCSAAKA